MFIKQAHVEMTIVSGTFGFAVPRRSRPRLRQVIQAVPVNARHASDEQLSRAAQAELLNLFGAKSRSPNFRDPDRQVRHSVDFLDLVRPLVNGPVVPVKGKAV